jgi:hypothetical protein
MVGGGMEEEGYVLGGVEDSKERYEIYKMFIRMN